MDSTPTNSTSADRLNGKRLIPVSFVSTLLAFAALFVNSCAPHAAIIDHALPGRAHVVTASTPQPTPTLHYPAGWNQQTPHSLSLIADHYIAQMTLDEELGQLFIANFVGTDYPPNDAAMIEKNQAGGVILYSRSLITRDQASSLITTTQAHSNFPAFIMTDQEGGGVDRLKDIFGPMPSARTIALNKSTEYAQQQGVLTGRNMAALGLNLDLAPDVDVQVAAGPDLGSRNFGTDPQTVTTYAGAFLTGLQSQGVIGCLKHFPGLGASTIDAHLGLPVIDRTRAQIEAVELAPYRDLIATGQVQCVMTTDLLMPAYDTALPAELSPTIVNGLLRQDMNYDGVIVTDALYMDGIAAHYSMPEAGVLAILAGNDLLEGPSNSGSIDAMTQALKSALASGRLTKARVDQSVRRILMLKMRIKLLTTAT